MKEIKLNKKTSIYTIGRPIKYSYEYRLDILEKLAKYIEKEEYPTIPEFCVRNRIQKQRIYEFANDEAINQDCKGKYQLGEYFTDCIKRMNDKQEAFMESGGINGTLPTTFTIFKLKNLGWKDKIEEEHNNETTIIEAFKILSTFKQKVIEDVANGGVNSKADSNNSVR